MGDVVDMDPYLKKLTRSTSIVPALKTNGQAHEPEMRAAAQSAELRSLASVLVERMQFLRQAGITFKGARDLYEVLGYDRDITTTQYRDRYARGGVAGRIVDALPKATWRGGAELVEDENPKISTTFEKAWVDLQNKFNIWAILQRADILSRLGPYAILLIGAPGSLSEELPRGRPDSLLYFTPFAGGGGPGVRKTNATISVDADCTIKEFERDITSPRFGLPKFYQLSRSNVNSPDLMREVHWTRVVHIAEGCLDDDVFGQPALERCWNLLDDLDKVTGGGAEAFWLRANQGLQLDVDKDMSLGPTAAVELASLKEQAEEYQHQIRRILRTRGVTATPLGSDTANFGGPADAVLTQIAGACSIPKRILTGSEMGQLASAQDRDNWTDQVHGRRESYAGPYIVRALVQRLIDYRYLPTPTQFEVRWPSIQTLTEAEKWAGASAWAKINSSSPTPVFTNAELRDKWYQMEPLPAPKAVEPPSPGRAEPRAAALSELSRLAELNADWTLTENGLERTFHFPDCSLSAAFVTAILEDAKRIDHHPSLQSEYECVTVSYITRSEGELTDRDFGAARRADKTAEIFNAVGSGAEAVVEALERAIVEGDVETVDQIVGLSVLQRKFSSSQIDLPRDIAERVRAFALTVPVEDLAEDGREADPHITVKYGLHDSSPSKLQELLRGVPPFTVHLGRTRFFRSDEYDVLLVEAESAELTALNDRISRELDCTTTHADYTPHVTIAYIKPGLGEQWAGDETFLGQSFTVTSITFSSVDDEKTVIELK